MSLLTLFSDAHHFFLQNLESPEMLVINPQLCIYIILIVMYILFRYTFITYSGTTVIFLGRVLRFGGPLLESRCQPHLPFLLMGQNLLMNLEDLQTFTLSILLVWLKR